MWHPLQPVASSSARWLVFGLLLALTIGLAVLMLPSSNQLKTVAAPQGIVSLELAGTSEKAHEIVESWQRKNLINAALQNLNLDNFFLLVYSTTIALACIVAAEAFHKSGLMDRSLGLLLAWFQWLAALLDVIENIALRQMVQSAIKFPWPEVAWGCATYKFILIFAGIGYGVVGLVLPQLK